MKCEIVWYICKHDMKYGEEENKESKEEDEREAIIITNLIEMEFS